MNMQQILEAEDCLYVLSKGYRTGTCGVCGLPSRFVLEWYSFNQFGEDPFVIQGWQSCRNFRHLARLAIAGHDGSPPEAIVDFEHYNEDHPDPKDEYHTRLSPLLNAILQVCENPEKLGEIARTFSNEEQLVLDLY